MTLWHRRIDPVRHQRHSAAARWCAVFQGTDKECECEARRLIEVCRESDGEDAPVGEFWIGLENPNDREKAAEIAFGVMVNHS